MEKTTIKPSKENEDVVYEYEYYYEYYEDPNYKRDATNYTTSDTDLEQSLANVDQSIAETTGKENDKRVMQKKCNMYFLGYL